MCRSDGALKITRGKFGFMTLRSVRAYYVHESKG